MKFALIEGQKVEAFPNQKGICQLCKNEVISKCGNQRIWHWAHASNKNCDSWWENETEWHRQWKSYFSKEYQEVVQFDEYTGEKHIADVKTKNKMVIEFQNSPINEKELLARELFYKKMFWIINGLQFENNFILGAKLPSPYSEEMKDNQIYPVMKNTKFTIWLKSENNNHKPGGLVKTNYEKNREDYIQELIKKTFDGHFLFTWKNQREVWIKSHKPVFIDLGDKNLYKLKLYGNQSIPCVRVISKRELIQKNGGTYII